MPFAPVGRGGLVVDEVVEEVDEEEEKGDDAVDDTVDPEIEDAEFEADVADEADGEPEVDAADFDVVEAAVDATAVLWTADSAAVVTTLANIDEGEDEEADEEGKERIKTVLVIVPYTVLFLNTVSGLNVTVALFVSVNIKTSVVCTLTSCLHPTSTANLPEVGRTTLGLGILKEALAA